MIEVFSLSTIAIGLVLFCFNRCSPKKHWLKVYSGSEPAAWIQLKSEVGFLTLFQYVGRKALFFPPLFYHGYQFAKTL